MTLNWDQPGDDGTFIVNLTEDVVAAKSGDDYTYSGGYVRIEDRRGRPKDQVRLRCPNTDTVVVTLGSV